MTKVRSGCRSNTPPQISSVSGRVDRKVVSVAKVSIAGVPYCFMSTSPMLAPPWTLTGSPISNKRTRTARSTDPDRARCLRCPSSSGASRPSGRSPSRRRLCPPARSMSYRLTTAIPARRVGASRQKSAQPPVVGASAGLAEIRGYACRRSRDANGTPFGNRTSATIPSASSSCRRRSESKRPFVPPPLTASCSANEVAASSSNNPAITLATRSSKLRSSIVEYSRYAARYVGSK